MPIANADEVDAIVINVDWGDDHAYIISGDVDISEINVTHQHNSELLETGLIYDTTGEDLRVVVNTSLSHGDTITIQAGSTSRTINVGIWGQPLADHEVTLNSQWEMDQCSVRQPGCLANQPSERHFAK